MKEKSEDEKIRVSFSSLNWLEISPAFFQAMKNGELAKEESKSMDFGKATHCYVLRPNDFQKEYYVMEANTPDNAQQNAFAKLLATKMPYNDAYRACYSLTGKSEKTIEDAAAKLYMQLQPYANSLALAENRTIISSMDFARLSKMSDSIQAHKGARKLFDYAENHKDSVVFIEHEFMQQVRKLHDEKDLYIHGFIDHMIFDPNNRKMIINELKTTSDAPKDYRESFEKYHTARQLAMYSIAAGKLFEKTYPDISLKEMSIEWNIIVVQSMKLFETKVYAVNAMDIENGMHEYRDLINRYVFHYKEGWDYSQEYYTNEGIERL